MYVISDEIPDDETDSEPPVEVVKAKIVKTTSKGVLLK